MPRQSHEGTIASRPDTALLLRIPLASELTPLADFKLQDRPARRILRACKTFIVSAPSLCLPLYL
jgi:hypothetical protein